MLKFDRPTLVTLTAPTCSGKSYLLNALTDRGAGRIISTTTRPRRDGETEGVDYHFISLSESCRLQQAGEFFELIEFNSTRYGVTYREMRAKMAAPNAPIVILEPQGLAIYEQKCREYGWDIYKVYVHVDEKKKIDRLNSRTTNEIVKALSIPTGLSRLSNVFDAFAREDHPKSAEKILAEHTRRLLSITGPERLWSNVTVWDTIVPGDDVEKAISMLEHGVAWRNRQRAEPQATGSVKLPL